MPENHTKETLTMINTVDHHLKGVKLPLLGKRKSLRQMKSGAARVRLVYLLKLRVLRDLKDYTKMTDVTYKRLSNKYTRIIKMLDYILDMDEREVI